ncbi:MAG: DUF1232 domain-containing protein [Longimicrobiales bacterium]
MSKKRLLPGKRRRRTNPMFDILRQLPNLVKLVLKLLVDARVSLFDRALFATVIAYVLSPFDLVPDWLGLLGLTDDLYLVGLALGRLLKRAGPDLLLEHWSGRPHTLGYLMASVERVGARLPRSIRRILQGTVFRR